VNTYIIFPSGVYGRSAGPKKALGVIQLLYKLQAEEIGFVPYIGEGSSLFQSLHAEDFPPFMLKVVDEALKNPEPTGSVYSRFYIITSQELTWKETSTAFAKLFHAQGIVSSPEAKSVPLAEAGSGELPDLLQGGSMLLKNDRAKRLGWKPVKEGLVEFLEDETKLARAGKQ
jgi:nucleoside-diphosphate-sugar epimerase